MKKEEESLFEKLKEYKNKDYYPFHMPGHKRNINLGVNIYDIDITEIDEFDNLHDAAGIIEKLQNRVNKLYEADQSFVMVNGSTGGILSAIYGCTNQGDTILISRNCHKSVYNAAELRELDLEYVYPKEIAGTGIYGEVTAEDIEKKILENPEIKVVVITTPTYEGVVSDVNTIASIVHKYKKLLIVDAAHGAHLPFHEYFPKSPISQGADVVIHSLHKTLPALTQSASIHIKGNRVNVEKIKDALSIFQTSSPSYVLMSGMDVCANLLETKKEKLFREYVIHLEKLRKEIKKLKSLKLLETECYDKSKIVIYSDKITGLELYNRLRNDYHLQPEMANLSHVVLMTSVFDSQDGYDRLIKALFEIDDMEKYVKNGIKIEYNARQMEENVKKAMKISAAKKCNLQEKELFDSEKDICGEYMYLYPPGIPIIVPGEMITAKVLEEIQKYLDAGLKICGVRGEINHRIKVVN